MKRIFAAFLALLFVCLSFAGCDVLAGYSEVSDIVPENFSESVFISELERAVRRGDKEIVLAYRNEEGLSGQIDDILSHSHERYVFGISVMNMEWEIASGLFKTTVTVSFTYTGRIAPAVSSARDYSQEALISSLREAALGGEVALHLLFTPGSAAIEEVEAGIRAAMDGSDHICGYYLSNVSFTVTEYSGYTYADLLLEYEQDVIPYDELMVCTSPLGAASYLKQCWQEGSAAAVFLYEGELSDGAVHGVFQTAEANFSACASVSSQYTVSIYGADPAIVKLARVDLPDAAAIDRNSAALASAVRMTADALESTSEKNLLKEIYHLLADTVEYDAAMADHEINSAAEAASRSAYGALIEKNTVCSGYARAYKELCEAVGLNCWVVCGEHEGEGHEWNMVQLEDGELLYVDATFGDTAEDDRFCLFDSEDLEKEGYTIDENYILPW